MKQIIYSGVLAILGMIASIDSAIAQVENPSDTLKTFTDWCLNQNDLTPEARHTVQVLLEEAETEECDRASVCVGMALAKPLQRRIARQIIIEKTVTSIANHLVLERVAG